MQFHACWVIYTVKELDSNAKHGQSFRKRFGRITECFCAKYTLPGFLQVSESFFRSWLFMTSWRVELLVWAFLPEEREQEQAHQRTSFGSATRDSLGNNVSKECLCVFGCKVKITLFSFPKNPALHEQWMQFVFRGSFSQVCLLTNVL